jgi:hypothetical protein
MKKQLIVRLKSGLELTFVPNEVSLDNTFIPVAPLLNENDFPLLLHFTHNALVTTLNLSKMPDCVLLHLKEDYSPKSAAYCINRSEGDFTVQSQCRHVLFIPFPIPFQLSEIVSIRLSKKSKP